MPLNRIAQSSRRSHSIVRPKHGPTRYYSSVSTGSTTRSNSLSPRKQRRTKARGRRMDSPPVSPQRRSKRNPKVQESDEQGRFKKLTNKLAIIFHHQHHHHHHIHAGEDHEKSLWKYLKGIVHVRKGRGEVQGKVHRHNLGVLMEWFFRHLWWMRRQKGRKKIEKGRLAKKVKWWEWFRRKRGVAVGGRRRNRLRLGFNSSRRRSGGGKG